mgnify:CR=1 FL=1
MKQSKRNRRARRGFTLVELLVVIVIIGILASLVVGLSGTASRKMRESRTRVELVAIETAIEAYKANFGHYPPCNPDNPVLNTLYYELTGALYSPVRKTFRDPKSGVVMEVQAIKEHFGVEGFVNTARSQSELKTFFEPNPKTVRHISEEHDDDDDGHGHEIHHADEVHVLCAPVPWPMQRDDHPVRHHGKVAKGVNPWRYVTGQPVVNNIGKYDLWAEIVVGDEVLVISNWRKETFSRETLHRDYKKKKR